MPTEAERLNPVATILGAISLTSGVAEWLAILGCLAANRLLGPIDLEGEATLTMFASLPVMLFGVPLGVYGAWRGCKWVGVVGAALCLLSYALSSFILHDIVGNR